MANQIQPFERHALIFLLKHLVSGVVGALVLGCGLLALDVGGLRTMATADPDGIVAVILLFCGLIITFGSVAMGIGIMALGER